MVKAYQFLKKHGVTIGFSTGGALSVLAFMIIIFGLPSGLGTKELYEQSAFNFGLFVTYALFFVASLAAVIFPIIYLAQNFKESTKLLISLGLLVVVAIVAYVMASGETSADIAKAVAVSKMTPSNLKTTEMILYLGYILFFIALGSVLFSFIRPMIAKK